LANKENSSNKSTATDLGAGNPSDQLYPSQKATKAYVDNSIYAAVGTGVPDATTNAAGKVKLAGDLAGTAAIPLVAKIQGSPVSSTTPTTGQVLTYNGTSWAPAAPGSSNKEDVSNKSDAALGTSTTLYPTQNAVKTYVDAQVASATIVDADATTRGKIQLAGDLGGTATSPSVVKINGVSLAGLSTGILKNTTTSGILSIAVAGTDYLAAVSPGTTGNVLTSNGTTWISSAPANGGSGSVATLTTARTIYGNSFDGSANVTGVIAANFGGTGNGFTKFTGASGSEKTYTLPNVDAVILTNQTTVAINQGGTGATNKTAAFDALSPMSSPGDIIYGTSGGSGTRLAKGSDNQVLTIVNGLPAWSTASGVSLPQDANEESLSTLAQTSFTLGHTPVSTSKVKMYINGIRISNSAYSISGTTVSYNAVNNGAYDLALNDRIQFDYQY
jgi:hypothetical protein